MNDLLEGLRQALHLLLAGDPATRAIVVLSLYVSGAALGLSALLGLPPFRCRVFRASAS